MAIKISHNLNIGTEWIEEIREQLDSTFINENTLVISKQFAKGYFYFKEIIPGLMVQIIDFISLKEIELTRLSSSEEFYILFYNVDSPVKSNTVEVLNDKGEIILGSGFSVIPNHVATKYVSTASKRSFFVAITISKLLFEEYLGDSLAKSIKNKNFNLKNSIYYFNKIDSRTMVLLLKLKELNYDDPNFRFSVKGNILQILGYSIARLKWEDNLFSNKLKEFEYDQIAKSQDYLMSHLYESFPGIIFLSKMAGMNNGRYTTSFKKIYQYTPKQFFLRKKLSLANNMLQSGGYRSIESIAYDLGFGSIINFSRLYFLRYGVLPKSHFVKFK